jgi:hypothetical protein
VELMVKQYFIPTADFANVIEVDAAAGVGVAPTTPGTYRAIAGVLASGELTVSPPPAFTARAAAFDGSTYYAQSGQSVAATNVGICSFWFRNRTATWNTPTATDLFQFRLGGTTAFSIITASSGRLTFRINQDGTGSDIFLPPSSTFALNTWYHVLWAWDWANSRFQLYVNNVAQTTTGYSFAGATKFDQSGDNFTNIGIGAESNGVSPWIGDIGHLLIDFQNTLDISNSANREKFVLSGNPVDLGTDGSTPLGLQPQYYYDGDGASWNNKGTAGNITLTGTLTAASGTPGF